MDVNRRAAPLPPAERRSAIVAATVPLLRQFGLDVTTRQIAAAAGVAEGTLFRVFDDKESLIKTAMAEAFSPTPLLLELAQVSTATPLAERLLEITQLLQDRLRSVIDLMTAVRMQRPPGDDIRRHPAAGRDDPSQAIVVATIAGLLEPDRDQLSRSPQEVARLLRLLTFAGTHIGITDGAPLTPFEIVSVLLDGVRQRGPSVP